MSVESSQSKNERGERERVGDGKVPKKKKIKESAWGGWAACIRDVCVLRLLGTAALLSVE